MKRFIGSKNSLRFFGKLKLNAGWLKLNGTEWSWLKLNEQPG